MFGIKTNSLFGETKKLEREIDEFVDILSEVGLVFNENFDVLALSTRKSIYIMNLYLISNFSLREG